MPTWDEYQRAVKMMAEAIQTHLPTLQFEADLERKQLEIRAIANLPEADVKALTDLALRCAQTLPGSNHVIVLELLDLCHERFAQGQTYIQVYEWMESL